MARVIRFRAWDTLAKKMYAVDWKRAPLTMKYEVAFGSRDIVPMQFTGLLDKNGKEIYEGDVVEFTDKWEWYRSVYGIKMMFARGDERAALKAKYDAEPMYRRAVEFDPHEGYGLTKGDLQNYLAVIGNVHENPDLIQNV